jgi:hypothetical protein
LQDISLPDTAAPSASLGFPDDNEIEGKNRAQATEMFPRISRSW